MRLPAAHFFLLLFSTLTVQAQVSTVTLSGTVRNARALLPFVNVTLLTVKDSAFVTGAITSEEGLFAVPGVKAGNYLLKISYIGYQPQTQPVLVGQMSEFLNLGTIELTEAVAQLGEVTVTAQADAVAAAMDKKTFIAGRQYQSGGRVGPRCHA